MSRRAKITKRSFPVFYPYIGPETAKLDNAVVWPTLAAVRRCGRLGCRGGSRTKLNSENAEPLIVYVVPTPSRFNGGCVVRPESGV